MQVSISSPNLTISFTADEFNEQFAYVDMLIVTELNFSTNKIIDHAFDGANLILTDTLAQFSTNYKVLETNTFEPVHFLTGYPNTFMDVFKAYDGEIISYNNGNILCRQGKCRRSWFCDIHRDWV